jgi:alanine racemase
MSSTKPFLKHSTWVEVDLRAIESNVRYFVENTQARVMAVVKANAYGHGSGPAAKAAIRGGATWLGVARPEEALELRRSGMDVPILVLGLTPYRQMPEVIAAKVSMTVWDLQQVQVAAAAARNTVEHARLHLKVDTGMSRLGVEPEDAVATVQRIVQFPTVALEGVYTHFARADEHSRAPTEAQVHKLEQVLTGLDAARLRPALVHAANSAATLMHPGTQFDMVRVGISIYGLHPSVDCKLPASFWPALSWKAQLSQVKILPPGRGVSYGHTYHTHNREMIGTVPVGYADGFRRIEGNEVLVGGQRVPVVGRVCMDQVLVQLDAIPTAKGGDEVVLIGEQGKERITAEEVAARWGTINYEVTSGIAARVPRVLV